MTDKPSYISNLLPLICQQSDTPAFKQTSLFAISPRTRAHSHLHAFVQAIPPTWFALLIFQDKPQAKRIISSISSISQSTLHF